MDEPHGLDQAARGLDVEDGRLGGPGPEDEAAGPQTQDELKAELNLDSNLMAIAGKIEDIALNDDYFVSRNLYPNIDFYTGIILTALQIPKSMFTPIFVIGRTVGWITQWIEFKQDKRSKIARPRQLYTGD